MSNAFSGYPFDMGGFKKLGQIPNGHAGPNPYVVMTTGPLAGGDTVQAVDFALKSIEQVISPGLTSDGLYWVDVVGPTSGPVTSVRLLWTVVSTGLQAGAINLSGSTINLTAIGF